MTQIGWSINQIYRNGGQNISISDLMTDLADEAWRIIEFVGEQLALIQPGREVTWLFRILKVQLETIEQLKPDHPEIGSCKAIKKFVEWYETEPPANKFNDYYESQASRWMLLEPHFLEYYRTVLAARRHAAHEADITTRKT